MGKIFSCIDMVISYGACVYIKERPVDVTQVELEKLAKDLQEADSTSLSQTQRTNYRQRYKTLERDVNTKRLKGRKNHQRLQRIKIHMALLSLTENATTYGSFSSTSELEKKEANLRPPSRRTNNTETSETKATCHNDKYPTFSESSKSQLMGDTTRQGIEDGNEDVEMGEPLVEERHKKTFEKTLAYVHNECQNQKESETGDILKPNNQRNPFLTIGEEQRAIQEGSFSPPQTTNYSAHPKSHTAETSRIYAHSTRDDGYHKPGQQCEKRNNAAERIASSVQPSADNDNFDVFSQREEYSILEPHKSIDSGEEQTNHEEVRKENQSHGFESHSETQPPCLPEPEKEPLKILDVGQYFRDDLDLNSLNGLNVADQIDRIEAYSKTFENQVENFSEEKFSLEYFVLDEKLMRLIEKLDKIESPDDELTARKIKVIQYIQGLHEILDERAIDD